jgi:Mg2+ and Co2+ transporter CorA
MTALATLAMPLLLITGIYGMNFGENPELGPRWIYHAISGALLGSIPVMLYYFWKYRWL